MSSNYGLFAGTSRATSGRGHSPALTAVASVMAATGSLPRKPTALRSEPVAWVEALRQLSHGHVLPRGRRGYRRAGASKLQTLFIKLTSCSPIEQQKTLKNKVLAPVGMPNLQICKIVADNNPEWKSGLEKEYEKLNERDSLENCLAARDYVPPLVKKCKDGNPQFGDPISSDLLKVHLPTLAARIIQIRRSQVIASHNKKERKTEIKEAARLRAATAPVEKTVEQLVQQEVRKKMGVV
ncbi:hypothetical protein EV401DRAFT_2025345 [Pisolithus croceorrhizus]|nr:hypothetical protein EV401DRAFT_2025345 [Pisolithus croceorrhizus]